MVLDRHALVDLAVAVAEIASFNVVALLFAKEILPLPIVLSEQGFSCWAASSSELLRLRQIYHYGVFGVPFEHCHGSASCQTALSPKVVMSRSLRSQLDLHPPAPVCHCEQV